VRWNRQFIFAWRTEAVVRMLNFGSDVTAESWSDTWKVVIFDEQCRDILSQLLKIGDLRKQGVTLNLCVTFVILLLLLLCIEIRVEIWNLITSVCA
jgi:hypothetical protein